MKTLRTSLTSRRIADVPADIDSNSLASAQPSGSMLRSAQRRRLLGLGAGMVLAAFLCACGHTSTPTAIAITTTPPTNMEVSQTATIAATLSGSIVSAGVNWSCAPAASCGSFSPAHTASGASTTYQAPASAGTVTITAASTAQPSIVDTATVTIGAPTVSITTAPPATLTSGQTASIAATVNGDSLNAGVDWSCTPAPSCGTFTPAHTASGASTTYQAPSSAGTVTITAASTTQPSAKATATVTIQASTISITTAPPATLVVGQTASVAATVNGDPLNAGVDWTCAPVGNCGTFSPAHTASGASTTYQAPANAGTVTITAASTTQPSVNATATIIIQSTTANLNGAYTFFANGWDTTATSTPYPSVSVAGTITIDGSNGTITGGEEDFFAADTSTPVTQADAISPTGSTITLGTGGRGTLTLQLTSPDSLGSSTETFSIVRVNDKHLLITEFDGAATSSGSLDLQTSPASVPMNGNAFALYDPMDRVVFGGVLTSTGTTITGEGDDNDFSLPAPDLALTVSGSITPADADGRGTLTLTLTDSSSNVIATADCAYYVVGPEVFRLIEIDGTKFASGSIYGQGNTSGAFSTASLGGSFAFDLTGEPISAFFYDAAGEFTTNSSPTSPALTSGVADVNMGNGSPLSAAPLASGSSYAMAANGYGSITLSPANTGGLANFGVYMVDPALNLADPNSTTGGGGALVLNLDENTLGIGIVVPQTAGATFSGNYAYSQDGAYQASSSLGYFDILGQLASDGTSQLTGSADYNDLDATGLNAGIGLTGTFASDGANPGRSTAQLTLSGQATPNNLSTTNVTLYQANDDLIFHVDMDSSITAVGVFEKQQ